MTVVDLRLDAREMTGKLVEVRGSVSLLADIVILTTKPFDTTGVFVETKNVSREQRRRVLELCSRGCTAIVAARPRKL